MYIIPDNKYLPIINIIAEQFIDQHNKDNFLFTDEIVDRTYKEILKDLEINMLERSGKPYSVNAPRALLKRMGRDETLHGFRATFKSWATDKTMTQREVIEMALAHKIGNEVEASYLRTSAIEKRRELMEHWSRYCDGQSAGKIVKLHA